MSKSILNEGYSSKNALLFKSGYKDHIRIKENFTQFF